MQTVVKDSHGNHTI